LRLAGARQEAGRGYHAERPVNNHPPIANFD